MTAPQTVRGALDRDLEDALVLAAAARVLLERPDKMMGDEVTAAILSDRAGQLAPADPDAARQPWASTVEHVDGLPVVRRLQLVDGGRDE